MAAANSVKAEPVKGAYSVSCGSGFADYAFEPRPSWLCLSLPSTPRRRKYESGIGAARSKSLKMQGIWPLLLTCGRSMRRTTWMAGTSPAMTLNPPADLYDYRNRQLTL